MALDLVRALAHSPLTAALNRSVWAFAVIEMAHLMALAVFGGGVIVSGLRALGVWLRGVDRAALFRSLAPVMGLATAALLITGALLFSSAPVKYVFNLAFRWKMLLLVAELTSYFILHQFAVRPPGALAPAGLSALAVLTMALALAVGVAGRLIGLL